MKKAPNVFSHSAITLAIYTISSLNLVVVASSGYLVVSDPLILVVTRVSISCWRLS